MNYETDYSERFLGEVINFDPKNNIVSIKIDFLDPDRQQIIEDFLISKKAFSFCFRKAFRRLKTYPQLKRYYALLKKILIKCDIFPSAENIKTLDMDTKKRSLPCEYLYLDETIKLPIPPPSKADMSIEELNTLMLWVEEAYSYLNIDWSGVK